MEYASILPKQDSARLAGKYERSTVEANLPTYHFEERMFFIWPYLALLVVDDMKSVRFTEDAIPIIFDKLGNAKTKRSNQQFQEKLNRKLQHAWGVIRAGLRPLEAISAKQIWCPIHL